MTTRQARRERREAERKEKKAEFKRMKAAGQDAIPAPAAHPSPLAENDSELEQEFSGDFIVPADSNLARVRARAETNRLNAKHSTGPRTATGKAASSRNSLKHGLASGEMIIPGEDQAALDALRRDLLEEHRPANPTEDLLVTEMAQSWWLTQRALRFQNECFSENGVVNEKRLSLFLRYQTTHERAFHKALNMLTRLKQNRARQRAVGFVSHTAQNPEPSEAFSRSVSQNRPSEHPEPPNQEVNASKAA